MIGRHISHFYVIRTLGSGGAGVVYEAQDTRLPRSVALKILKPGLAADVDATRRFRREARLAASLNHPNICTILDVDDVGGQLVIAMELLRGRSLRERLARGPVPLTELLNVGIRTAAALGFAHGRGILHRDITPANIFITDDERVKVLDFGLAHRMPTGDETTTDTPFAAGSVYGTAPYMAPELFAAPDKVDHRGDLYALGAVLYEMATGAKLFDARSRLDLVELILEQPHVPVRRMSPHCPPALAAVVDRLLAKDPRDRHNSAAEVQVELEAIRDAGTPASSARPEWAPRPVDIAVLPFSVSPSEWGPLHSMAEGIAEDICSALSLVPQLRVAPRTLTGQLVSLAADEAARRLGVALVVTGQLSRNGERFCATATVVDARVGEALPSFTAETAVADVFGAQDHLARQIAGFVVGRVTVGGLRPETTDAEALQQFTRGQHHWQERFAGGWLPAVEHFERAVTRDPSFAQAHVALARTYEFLGSFSVMKPKVAFGIARRSVARALELNDRLASAYVQLALIELGGDWNWEASETAFRRAIDLEPDNAVSHVCYAWLLTLVGREAAAIEEAHTAHQLAPRSRFVLCGWAHTLYLARRYQEAVELCSECLRADPDYLLARLLRGQCFELQGKADEAVADLESAVMMTRNLPYFIGVLGHCYGLVGMRQQALSLLPELDRQSRDRYVPPQAYVFIYGGLGEREKALAFQERAYEDGASPFNYLAPYIRDLYALDPHHKERLAQMRLAI